MSEERKREIANILLKVGAVTLSPEKPFLLNSGIRSPIYCDNRLITSYPEERKILTKAFLRALEEQQVTCEVIAGVATGGIPYAAWVAAALNKPMIYIRGKLKEHGKQNLIEGKLEQGQRVAIIEDLVSTGGSSIAAIEAVRNAGGVVEHCIAIFSYEFPEAAERFQQLHCTLATLTSLPMLLSVAREKNKITAAQQQLIKNFSANPRGWEA